MTSFWEKYNGLIERRADGCWIWGGAIGTRGYGQISAVVDGKRTTIGAHRAAFEAQSGPIPCGLFVCHSCDTPACVNPDHLWLGTPADNMRDKQEKGRCTSIGFKGEAHPKSRLTEHAVRDIRVKRSLGMKLREIAEIHGVSTEAVAGVVYKRRWTHVL